MAMGTPILCQSWHFGLLWKSKQGNPIRPIISQIPTHIYHVSKILNNIIIPYIPNKNNITHEFIQILNSNPPYNNCITASLDVEIFY